MKRKMWLVAMIPMVVTSIVVQFLPDVIPMHHDMAGNIDRWGNKAESFIVPILILVIAAFWHAMGSYYEKKALCAKTEKEQMEARSSAKFLLLVGIVQSFGFGVLHYFILYSSYQQAIEESSRMTLDIAKISCLIMGISFIIIGNFGTKVKKNSMAGVRTTWRKSNHFGAICLMITGLLTVVTAAFTGGMMSTVLMLIYVLIMAAATVVYSKKVYDLEIKKTA